MKNVFFSTLCLLFASLFALNANAQTPADEAALRQKWNAVWQAYESGNEAAMWAFYADNACEIYPDGSSLCGLANIKAGYEQFKSMMEGTPSWTMTPPTITFIGSDVALLISDVTADIKLKGGQQIGGPSKFATIVHKVKGEWYVVFDSQTPVIPMTDAGK